MKKFVVFLMMLFAINPVVYGYTDSFLYMIDAMGIERQNVNGFHINEYIYENYKLIVYGDPIVINASKQRWKEVNNGCWVNNGKQGEYWILGQDYSGKVVHNELFPDDYNSGTSPLNWNYRVVKNAEESWNDTTLYMYDSQKEYMLTQKLSRFGITYDLTALDIGLDKARVENYATWRSAGSIYTEKPGEGNIYWAATFNVPPMAGDAKLNSILIFPNGTEYTISKDEESIEIPYIFGAQIDELSEYAKAEHIKIIESELKIDGIQHEILSASETVKITRNGSVVVNKCDYSGVDKIILKFELNSFASTYFLNDPVMYSGTEQTIIINIENEERVKESIVNDENAPRIYSIKLKRVSTDNYGRMQDVELYTNKKTRSKFICAGQMIKIEVKTSSDAMAVSFSFNGLSSISTLDETTKKFLWTDPKKRNEMALYSSLHELEKSYDLPRKMTLKSQDENYKVFSATYVIPYETTQTLYSWNTLRNESKDAFKIDESKLFTRIRNPYRLVIKAGNYNGGSTETYLLDVVERWDELFNRDVSKYIN